jgi:hypothetical protein
MGQKLAFFFAELELTVETRQAGAVWIVILPGCTKKYETKTALWGLIEYSKRINRPLLCEVRPRLGQVWEVKSFGHASEAKKLAQQIADRFEYDVDFYAEGPRFESWYSEAWSSSS